ncbi:MAG: UDP-N-acetylmuramate--L-alanine ligase [Rhodospirillaceae bacterium]|nr:UDP-N-acetylmuramate--L-alanine ligase [Rhodospirillaceae bacterium]
MTVMPLSIGLIHFVGIGGIGMSGIAEILHNLKYQVQGSDISESANVKRLATLGINVQIGHKPENVANASVVVASSAILAENPEIIEARSRRIPVVRRAEMLAELMRLKSSIAVGGTHGKTTTTSLIASVLDGAGFDPTVINGGIINAYGTNARLGDSEWMVVEADESDGSFIRLPATIAIITNLDPEHLDFYGDFETEKAAFRRFVENIPFYGFAVACIDQAEVQTLIGQITDRRLVTYGLSPQAEVRGVNLKPGPSGISFDVEINKCETAKHVITGFRLPMFGEHNVLNALATIAVAIEMNIGDAVITNALAHFEGVKRRFTKVGEAGGVTIIDDYGHHPVEINAVLKAARSATQGKVIAVIQPHRYSRIQNLFEEFCVCFNDADTVIVSEIYAAGEDPIPGINQEALINGLTSHGHRNVLALTEPDCLASLVHSETNTGDLVVCLGAGSITSWANALPDQLAICQKLKKEAS